jgi:peptidoglycan-associated lipoprotein
LWILSVSFTPDELARTNHEEIQVRATIWSTTAAVIATSVFSTGCHHAQPSTPVPAATQPVANRDSIARANARLDSIARADAQRRIDTARADSSRRANEARTAALAAARADLTHSIHFDFDQTDVLAADRPVLDRKVALMRANPAVQLRIDGNTDERGSDEYNLALGMRRAASAKRYLTDRGVDPSRVAIISNGEERPICQGHDEICWMQNRRAEFVIAAGGDVLVAVRE